MDKLINKGFSLEIGQVMLHLSIENNPTDSYHGKFSFSSQIKDDYQYTGANIHMVLGLEISDLELRLSCHYQLKVGFIIFWGYF